MSRLPYREHFFLSSAVHKEACFPVAVTIALALGGGGGGGEVPSRIRKVLQSTAVLLFCNKIVN